MESSTRYLIGSDQSSHQDHQALGTKGSLAERWRKGKNIGVSIFIAKTYDILEVMVFFYSEPTVFWFNFLESNGYKLYNI